MGSASDTYVNFLESVNSMSSASSTEVDVEISSEDFDAALARAQADADSFWGQASTTKQALALLLIHVQEIIGTTRENHVALSVNHDGYLAKRK